jgi:hypothetical protein
VRSAWRVCVKSLHCLLCEIFYIELLLEGREEGIPLTWVWGSVSETVAYLQPVCVQCELCIEAIYTEGLHTRVGHNA